MTSSHVDWLFARQRFGVKPGLERVKHLLGDLGEPQSSFRTVLVGGTNGKGTTASALAACLRADDEHAGPIGLFTSPHLERVGERFVIDGEPVGDEALDTALRRIEPHAQRRDGTFFEIATVAAAWLFASSGVRTAVFEVGVGGRWDATNALEPVQSVITGVAYDHTDILGSELTEIARDKAGILRPGVPAATGATGIAAETIAAEADRLGAPLWRLGEEILVRGRGHGWEGQEIWIDTPAGSVHASTSLVGAHQQRNLALAGAVALRMGVTARSIEAAMPGVRWPGRLERFERSGRRVVLDGAHNPEAAAALVAAMRALAATPYTLVVGVGADKDVPAVARLLGAGAREVVTTRAARSPRATPPGELAAAMASSVRVERVVENAAEALAWAVERTPVGGTVLVAGSLYLVGEVRSLLTGRHQEPYPRLQ